MSSVGAFAKLADTNINAVAGNGRKVYRFQSTCTTNNFYVVTPAIFDDGLNGMGLDNNGNDTLSCISSKISTCVWKTGALKRVVGNQLGFDNYAALDSVQTCDRWFTQHPDSGVGSTHQCWGKGAPPFPVCCCSSSACHLPHRCTQMIDLFPSSLSACFGTPPPNCYSFASGGLGRRERPLFQRWFQLPVR